MGGSGAHRISAPGPLVVFKLGIYLTRKLFVDRVRAARRQTDVDQRKYCGHSFRIGAATTAATKGIEYIVIKTLRPVGKCSIHAIRGLTRSQLDRLCSCTCITMTQSSFVPQNRIRAYARIEGLVTSCTSSKVWNVTRPIRSLDL